MDRALEGGRTAGRDEGSIAIWPRINLGLAIAAMAAVLTVFGGGTAKAAVTVFSSIPDLTVAPVTENPFDATRFRYFDSFTITQQSSIAAVQFMLGSDPALATGGWAIYHDVGGLPPNPAVFFAGGTGALTQVTANGTTLYTQSNIQNLTLNPGTYWFSISSSDAGQVPSYAGGGGNMRVLTTGVGYGPATGQSLGFAIIARSGDGVPEPATWSMLIAGFGLVGGAVRLARRKPALNSAG